MFILEKKSDNLEKRLGNLVKSMESSEDDFLSADCVQKKVESIGYQQMHPVTDSHLGEFMEYLSKNMNVKECQQMTENIQKFFHALKESGLSLQARMRYLKCIQRFTGWLTKLPSIKSEGDSLITSLQGVNGWLTAWSRHDLGDGSERPKKSVEECQVLLRVAANDFKTAIQQNGDIHPSDYILVLNYLTALLSLKHLQRRSVIENFKVEEWATGVELRLDEKRFWTFYVKESQGDGREAKTAQPAAFCLNEEEHMWFQIYFDQFRPAYADKKDAHTEFFFLSTMGRKIHNAANDLNRIHRKYKLGVNTAGEARRAMIAFVKSRLEGPDLDLTDNYLSHSGNGVGKFYQFSQPINVCRAMLLITGETFFGVRCESRSGMVLSGEQPVPFTAQQPSLKPDVSARNIPAAHYATTNGDLAKAFDKLIEVHPVTLDGKPPSKTLSTQFFMIKPKSLIDKWAYAQRALRVQHIKGPRSQHKKAKGVKKGVVEKHIRHKQYKEALFEKIFRHGMDMLRSKRHHIYGQHLIKVSLSPFDSKRWIAEDGVHTLAYGHRDAAPAGWAGMDVLIEELLAP
ncbi:uncharacterized protein LOC135481372 [Liolophura sinensis]|uniref:uncharacterized protein LOC135481372 n=1 Tax=Liolophura sinensis TaxID=3198878 RepID=UPI003158BCA1